MIKYFCKNCNLEVKESVCSICNERADVKSYIYWCNHCNVPIYDDTCHICGNKGKHIATDLRPVFPEERLLIELLIGQPFKYKDSSVWKTSGASYIVDGKKIKLSQKEMMEQNPIEIIELIKSLSGNNTYDTFNKYIDIFIEANKSRYNYITTEATNFIIEQKNEFNDDETFVSFSGGKDSTVVSSLVRRALGMPNILHIFGDTTLEFPYTYEYVKRFKRENNRTPMIAAKNREKNFYEMCDIIGPPSRVMRWCCTVFKTGAINKSINAMFKNKRKILTFYGIRRSESSSRSKYDRVSNSPKITKQKVSSPIIDWFDYDIWLYILTTGIDFNDAYRLGYSRVGCWCCPNNTNWAQYLSKIYMEDESFKWREQLLDFARKVGKPDPEVYVDEGKWKARQGGNGVEASENIFVSFKPCAIENHSFNYEMNREITEELYELFKPFGWINYDLGNSRLGQVYIVDRNNNPLIMLQGRIGSRELKVSILKVPLLRMKNIQDIRMKIDCQITKYQLCLGCTGCESVCKHNAIISRKSINNRDIIASYKIDNEKCMRCGECVNHFDGGCYMRKVLMTKRSKSNGK